MSKEPMMVADVIDAVARGRIGHREAMERLGLDSYPQLVDTVHANGRIMWAHRPRRPDAKTMTLLALACRVEGRRVGESSGDERP